MSLSFLLVVLSMFKPMFAYFLLETSGMFRHFAFSTKTTQPHPQLFYVNSSIAARLTSSVDVSQSSFKFGREKADYDELCVIICKGEIFPMNNNTSQYTSFHRRLCHSTSLATFLSANVFCILPSPNNSELCLIQCSKHKC